MGKDKKYLLGMYEKSMPAGLNWKDKLNCCKESGFDWLEISIDESDEKLSRLNWSKDERQEVVEAMNETGIKIKTMCLSAHRKYPLGSRNYEDQKRSLEIMYKAVDLAEDLGIAIIQLAGYDVYYEQGDVQTANNFERNLKLAVENASKKGVLLGFETMETPFMDTVEKSMNYVNSINSPYLNVYPDIGNLTNAEKIYGVSVIDDILKGEGKIIAAHLKETKPGIYRDMKFGEGHTDYTSTIKALKSIGVRMFTGEFWYKGEDNWKEICKSSASFLRSKLDEVFDYD